VSTVIVSHADLLTRLAAQGITITTVGDGETLACQHGACVCLTELRCKGECITLARNLEGFEQALRGNADGREVNCELADTGKLCDISYFRFEGDIYRLEDRYFDATGHLVGQRNSTDYNQYCGGKAHVRFMGAVPDCRERARDVRLLCTDHRRAVTPLGNPMERLMRFLTPR
jgi:hypothetical protein